MMTDPKTSPADTDEQPPERKTKRLDMSGTQLVGGALAAMTAAVIGAQLGVAGTVLGAAIGSVVAGTAGSLYTASLKHTQNKIASAFVGRVGTTPSDHIRLQRQRGRRLAGGHHAEAAVAPPSSNPVATSAEIDQAGRPAPRWPWKPILISTAAVFLLAIAGITVFELITGQSLSGGQGTTITQVGEDRTGGTDTPSPSPSTETSTEPTTEPSDQPSTEPSTAPSGEENQVRPQSRRRRQAPAPNRPPAANRPRAVSRRQPRRPPPPETTKVPRSAATQAAADGTARPLKRVDNS